MLITLTVCLDCCFDGNDKYNVHCNICTAYPVEGCRGLELIPADIR